MKRTIKHAWLTALPLAMLITGAATAAALEFSMTAQPVSYPIVREDYRIDGYGRARFGMTPAQVDAIVGADYPSAQLADEVNPVERTHTLSVAVAQLAPGPGPATIHYVFGAASGTLTGVHVDWLVPGMASEAQQDALKQAGSVLVAGLLGYRWPPLASMRGRVAAPGVLVLFSGTDTANAGIEVRLDGIGFDVETPQATQTAAPIGMVRRRAPPGPARLRLSAIANNSNSDVYRIPAGAF